MVRDELAATWCFIFALRVLLPGIVVHKVAAKVRVDDLDQAIVSKRLSDALGGSTTHNCLPVEVLLHITAAISPLKVAHRHPPVARIRLAFRDIVWDVASDKVPDLDEPGFELCSIDTTTNLVERIAEAVRC